MNYITHTRTQNDLFFNHGCNTVVYYVQPFNTVAHSGHARIKERSHLFTKDRVK